ncbi:MAG: efflux RND transporter periplasmic adaptor subunit [Planctomycetales bacterium]|nr:efflux RND transporter periplasmic adaptor subunit [Planctomycetales bacterium]
MKWLAFLLKVSIVPLLVVLLLAWFRFAPIDVQSYEVQRSTIVTEVFGTGTLEAKVSSAISPKIQGRIQQVLVDQGDAVRAGDLLIQLDDQELQQQVAIARADTEAAQAALERLQADKQRATAVFDQAQRSYDRAAELASKNAVGKEELERDAESLAIAHADVARAEAAIQEGQQKRVAAEKTLQYQQARLDDSRITAPFDGLIVARKKEAGDVVAPGGQVLTLISTEVLWIQAWVDETEMDQLATGQTARVIFRSQPDQAFSGKVVRLGNEADRETREFIVEVQVLQLPNTWAVGQRADVDIETASKSDVVVIPGERIIRHQDEVGVFLNQSGVAQWHPIVTGASGNSMVEVTEGLSAGDQIVWPVAPGGTLRNLQRLRVQP